MTPEGKQRDEVDIWMYKASQDLHAAVVLVREGLYGEALFHSQQAAEKAIKGFLTRHRVRFPKTHDISELSPLCDPVDPSLHELLTEAVDLSN